MPAACTRLALSQVGKSSALSQQPILFTRFSALGDVASCLRVVDAAALAWPERTMTFVTHERYLSLVKLLRVRCDLKGYGAPGSAFPDFWSLRRWIDQERPLVVDLHGSTRTRVLRWMGDRRDWRVVNKKRLKRRSLCHGDQGAIPKGERVQTNQAELLDLEMPKNRPWLAHPKPQLPPPLMAPIPYRLFCADRPLIFPIPTHPQVRNTACRLGARLRCRSTIATFVLIDSSRFRRSSVAHGPRTDKTFWLF